MFLADAVDLMTALPSARLGRIGSDLIFRPANRRARVQGRIRLGRPEEWPAIVDELAGVPAALKAARPFRFDNVTVMNMADGVDPRGSALFDEGIIRLPSETCWFEYDIAAERSDLQIGLLVETTAQGMRIRRFCSQTPQDGLRGMQVDCYHIDMLRESQVDAETRANFDAVAGRVGGTYTVIHDPLFHLQMAVDAEPPAPVAMPGPTMAWMTMPQTFALYLTLALASNMKTIERVTAPKFANQRRRAKDLFPVPDHYVVTLPDGWAPGFDAENGGLAPWRREEIEKAAR